MKHLLVLMVASTALSSVGISTAMADPDFIAALSAGLGTLDVEAGSTGESADGHAIVGLLSGAYNFTPVLGAQGDLLFRSTSFDDDGDDLGIDSVDGALHGFYREPDAFLLGALVQVGKDTPSFNGADGPSSTRLLVGAEGQAFFNQLTVYGQVGWQKVTPEEGLTEPEGWFATGETRFFLTPDLKLEGHVGVSNLSADLGSFGSVDIDTVNLGAGIEYKFAELPFSVFGKYDFATTTADVTSLSPSLSGSFNTQRALVGVKFNLGEDSLQARDRNGAGLKPVDFGSNVNLFDNFGPIP